METYHSNMTRRWALILQLKGDLEMEQIYLKQLIEHLQKQLEEHGNLPVYYCDDALIGKQTILPTPSKIYSYKSYDLLNSDSLDVLDENLYDVDLDKPIIKAIIV